MFNRINIMFTTNVDTFCFLYVDDLNEIECLIAYKLSNATITIPNFKVDDNIYIINKDIINTISDITCSGNSEDKKNLNSFKFKIRLSLIMFYFLLFKKLNIIFFVSFCL